MFNAHLVGSLPFNSFQVPGANPSVVITRRPVRIDAETADRLKKALKEGAVPGVKPENVVFREIGTPASTAEASAVDAEEIADLKEQLEASAEEITDLKEQLEAARTPPADGHAADVLDSLTLDELRPLAEKRGLDLDAKAPKPEVIAALLTPPA